jgi:hypothetical protein
MMTDFEPFLRAYGQPENPVKPDAKLLDAYRARVPAEIIEFWERFGFSRYSDGLLWVVDPTRLQAALQAWVPQASDASPAIPIIRSAFGDTIYWREDSFMLLDVIHHEEFQAGNTVQGLFNVYVRNERARRSVFQEALFDKALKKLGPLEADEIYGFKLPLVMGGTESVKNLDRMKMAEHLSILAQAHGI